jgi:hypothetical protein
MSATSAYGNTVLYTQTLPNLSLMNAPNAVFKTACIAPKVVLQVQLKSALTVRTRKDLMLMGRHVWLRQAWMPTVRFILLVLALGARMDLRLLLMCVLSLLRSRMEGVAWMIIVWSVLGMGLKGAGSVMMGIC